MSQPYPSPDVSIRADIEELRRSLLNTMAVAGLMVSWLWIVALGAGLQDPLALQSLVPGVLLFMVSVISALARPVPVAWRSALFLFGVSALFLIGFHLRPSPTWLYYQSLLVAAAGLLAGPAASFAVALLLTLVFASILRADTMMYAMSEFPRSLVLLWAMALISWLSSRSLRTALSWALASQSRAWEAAEEARDRRGRLRRALDSLETTDHVLRRTILELEAARDEAEEARRTKARFVANISHELRTPLNVIVGFAEMLCTSPESYGDSAWSPALREDLLAIWRNAEHVLKMIDDVLDLAQIEVGHFPVAPEPSDLSAVARDALVTVSPLLRDSGLELRVSMDDDLPALNLDRTRIRQVLLNLINNALRFTHSGYIEVGTRTTGAEIVAYVRDTGDGIPADKLELIFEEFEQVQMSFGRAQHGVGLGLAISKHLMRMHGGRIWAESELGKGSMFCLAFPVPQVRASPQASELLHTQSLRRHPEEDHATVIALSRDPLVLRILERYLENRRVLGAESLADAISLVHEQHPQAVLMTIDTPRNRAATLQEAHALLRAIAPADLPVMACSFPTERRAGQALGVAELLVKPVTQNDVILAVKRLCPRPRRVLIADDDHEMRRLLARFVEQEWADAELFLAASGHEALNHLQQHPDVMLLDLRMPDMSGTEVIRAMRDDPSVAQVPVVVITAHGPADALTAVKQGELHIFKNSSFTANELVRVLDLLTKSLPPHYAAGEGALKGIPEAARA